MMGSQGLTSERLDGLCSQDQLDLLNAVDSLRSQDIRHLISLPQIIVCGDQSSGKSSVLEAISGVSFPVKHDTGTRFPTELILRKSDHVSANVSISPHPSRPTSEKDRLNTFEEGLSTFEGVHGLVKRAEEFMGVNSNGKGFSNDLLRIEISGPDRPHLTIVDLPGLIHSPSKSETAHDVQLIHDVVKGYMEEPRSIILAVVSAKNDYKNQIVLRLAQDADTLGARTLGVITKPDTLARGSGSEDTYLDLARNSHVELRLGWHVLRNRDSEIDAASTTTLAQRDATEDKFFSSTAWGNLPSHQLGIKTFRTRLSNLLLRQISTELPNLMDDIAEKTTTTQRELEKLGKPRATVSEQRFYLMQLSQDFQSLVQAARNGTYDHAFFGDAMTDEGYNNRIRAVVQNLSQDFSDNLAKKGSRYRIVDNAEEVEDSTYLNVTGGRSQDFPEPITRENYVSNIVKLLKRSRGRELPGLYNPMIVDTLFKAQSSPWEGMAAQHVRQLVAATHLFVQHVIDYISDPQTANGLLKVLIASKIEKLSKTVDEELAKLLQPHQTGHSITYNHYLTDTLQKIRSDREEQRVQKVISTLFNQTVTGWTFKGGFSLDGLKKALTTNEPDRDMDHFAASEALDYMIAYYKVARKRFVDDLAIEVIERNIVNKLQDMFSADDVQKMSTATVETIAGETVEGRQARESLTLKLQVLRDGWETCRKFADFRLRVEEEPSGNTIARPDRQIDGNISESAESTPDSAVDLEEAVESAGHPSPQLEPELGSDGWPREMTPVPVPVAVPILAVDEQESPGPLRRMTIKQRKKAAAAARALELAAAVSEEQVATLA